MLRTTYSERDAQGVPEQRILGDARVVVDPDPFRVAEDAVLGKAEVDAADGRDR